MGIRWGRLQNRNHGPRPHPDRGAAIPGCPGMGDSRSLGRSVLKPGPCSANQYDLVAPGPDLTHSQLALPLAGHET